MNNLLKAFSLVILYLFWKNILSFILISNILIIATAVSVYNTEDSIVIKPILSKNLKEKNMLFMINTIIHNVTFDILYAYIKKGFVFKIKIENLFIRIALFSLNLSYLFIKLAYLLIKNKKNIYTILSETAYRDEDNRILIKNNGIWEHNNGWLNFEHLFKKSASMRIYTPFEIDKMLKILRRHFQMVEEFNSKTELMGIQYLVRSESSKGEHWCTSSHTREHAMILTDKMKAVGKNNYNKDVIYNEFDGIIKKTTALEEKGKITVIKERIINEKEIYYGAVSHGYDKEKLSVKPLETIEELDEIVKSLELSFINIEFKEIGCKSLTLVKMMNYSLIENKNGIIECLKDLDDQSP